MHQLSKYANVALLGQATTAGSSNFTTAECVDMANCRGAMFIAGIGSTYPGAVTLAVYGSNTTGSFQALLGATKSTTAGNDVACVDVFNPRFRYLQPQVSSSAAAELMVFGVQYGWNANPPASTNVTAVVGVGT